MVNWLIESGIAAWMIYGLLTSPSHIWCPQCETPQQRSQQTVVARGVHFVRTPGRR